MVKKEGSKVYIEGVRQVTWDTGEMCEFASCLVVALQALGEDISYEYVMGTSGVAFRFTINPGQFDFGNYSIYSVSPDCEDPIRRAIEAAGYGYRSYARGDRAEDRARILASIDQGVAVPAYPVVGPSNYSVVTGYDEGGEVLLGWSTFQNIPDDHDIPPDTTGYFRKPGWHDNLTGYIILGEKQARRPLRAVYLDALRWAVCLARTPQMGIKNTGLEGLRVWADEMTQDAYYPKEDINLLSWRYLATTLNITQLRDHESAEPFLRQVAVDVPDFAPELTLAAGCYGQMKRLRQQMNDLISDDFSELALKGIGEPEVRRAFAQKILEIRDQEALAVSHFEDLLARCGQ